MLMSDVMKVETEVLFAIYRIIVAIPVLLYITRTVDSYKSIKSLRSVV